MDTIRVLLLSPPASPSKDLPASPPAPRQGISVGTGVIKVHVFVQQIFTERPRVPRPPPESVGQGDDAGSGPGGDTLHVGSAFSPDHA